MAGEFLFRVFDRQRFDQIRPVLEAVKRGKGSPGIAAVAREAVMRGPAPELRAAAAGEPTPRRERCDAVYSILKALCWPNHTRFGRYGLEGFDAHPCLAMLADCDGGLWGPLADNLPWFERWTRDPANESFACGESAIVLMSRSDCERLHLDLRRLAADLAWLKEPRPHIWAPDMRYAPGAFAHLSTVVGRAVEEPKYTLSFECPL